MRTVTKDGWIKIQSAILLYILNLQKGRDFEVECKGKMMICKSDENGLVNFKKGHHHEYGLKVSHPDETDCFIEPIYVESFPDINHTLIFHCCDMKIEKIKEEINNINKTFK